MAGPAPNPTGPRVPTAGAGRRPARAAGSRRRRSAFLRAGPAPRSRHPSCQSGRQGASHKRGFRHSRTGAAGDPSPHGTEGQINTRTTTQALPQRRGRSGPTPTPRKTRTAERTHRGERAPLPSSSEASDTEDRWLETKHVASSKETGVEAPQTSALGSGDLPPPPRGLRAPKPGLGKSTSCTQGRGGCGR